MKKKVPRFPKTIGVVTSPTGAAIRDILNVTKRRFCSAHVILYPVQVQGTRAPGEIAFAIDEMNRLGLGDVLIVGRGGGSTQDLWAFNDESVARAIAGSKIPIISAVGHEVDFTIADYVADLRAATPSSAAELVVQSKAELLEKHELTLSRLKRGMRQALALREQRLNATETALRLNSPERPIQTFIQRLDDIDSRLRRAVAASCERKKRDISHLRLRILAAVPTNRIASSETQVQGLQSRLIAAMQVNLKLAESRHKSTLGSLNSLMPQNVIKRGYAICQDAATGKLVSRTVDARLGANILVKLHDGSLGCRIDDISRSQSDNGIK